MRKIGRGHHTPFWARTAVDTLPVVRSGRELQGLSAAKGGEETVVTATTTAHRSEPLAISASPVRRSAVVTSQRPESPFLTTKEAAGYLRMSPRSLERLRFEGTGPRYRKAGAGKKAKVLYTAADLDAWLSQPFGSTSEY